MMDNFHTKAKETWCNRDMILHKDAEKIMKGTCEKQRRYKENRNAVPYSLLSDRV